MIEARNIHKHYGALHVLSGIDMSVAQGEIVSIVGPSGAGKTTLLQILGTLDSFDKKVDGPAPALLLNGTDVSSLGDKKLSAFRNKNIGFVFQQHQLLPEFTALENVCIPAMIAGRSLKEASVRGAQLLEFLNLSHRMAHRPSELSGGEQQRVSVARALINEPTIIFADEPSGNLDSKNAEELHNLFLDLRRDFGQTFVIVTHNPHLADIADRKITLVDGKSAGF